MDNELFELCKEVYGLTHWRLSISERPVEYWVQHDDEWDLEYGVVGIPVDGGVVPLYTSDYLLEKLHDATPTKEHSICLDYFKGTCEAMGYGLRASSGTPLKALLKLTIALHEEVGH